MSLKEHLDKIDDLTRKGIEAKEQRPFLFEIGCEVRQIRQEIANSHSPQTDTDPAA